MWQQTKDRDLGEILDFLRLLWGIEHLLRSTSKYMHARLGITGPQRLVLRIVEKFPGITAKEISTIIHLHPATLTGIVDRLSDRRLLTRMRDARDGRRVRLVPSAAASDSTPPITVESAIASAFSELRPLEIKYACRVLDVVASKLEVHAQEQAGIKMPKATRQASKPRRTSQRITRRRSGQKKAGR
jgi:MarR family transcriptional regulator, organic hydroperoxide resistance regulator